MNVDLPSDTVAFVDRLIASGEYQTVEAVVEESLRLLKGKQQLQRDIQQGLAELDAGQGINGDQVFADLSQRANR